MRKKKGTISTQSRDAVEIRGAAQTKGEKRGEIEKNDGGVFGTVARIVVWRESGENKVWRAPQQ